MKLSQLWQIRVLRKINKINIDEEHLYFALTFITGLSSGLVAVLIHYLVAYLTDYFQTNKAFTLSSFSWGLAAIISSGYITTRHFPNTSGSGIPQTKIAIVVYHGIIKFKDTLAKLVVSVLALSSGISLGREGPTVAVSAGIGSAFGNFFSLSKKRVKALVAIGASGGIAAAFNTPIAAVIFTLEEVVGDLNSKSLGPILIATIVASVTASAIHGSNPTFSVLSYQASGEAELLTYLIVGIVAAFLGPLWVKTVLFLRRTNKKIFRHHRLTTMVAAFCLIALFSHVNPMVLGSGHEVIHQALLSNLDNWSLLINLLVLKFFLTSICYSSGISGGLFMPTLFIGAMMGSIIGSVALFLFPEHTSAIGSYALVGMGAFFAAVIRAPLTSIIMIYEMTHDWKIILPLMIANISAFIISKKLQQGSIYENISEQDGVHLPGREDFDALDGLSVETAMVREVITLDASTTIKKAMKKIHKSEISGYPVLKFGQVFGVISTSEIGSSFARYQGEALIGDVCTKKTVSIYPDQSLMVAFHKLNKYKISRLLVVSRINDKRLVGIITAEDIVKNFGYHIEEESKAKLLDKYIKEDEEPKPPPQD